MHGFNLIFHESGCKETYTLKNYLHIEHYTDYMNLLVLEFNPLQEIRLHALDSSCCYVINVTAIIIYQFKE